MILKYFFSVIIIFLVASYINNLKYSKIKKVRFNLNKNKIYKFKVDNTHNKKYKINKINQNNFKDGPKNKDNHNNFNCNILMQNIDINKVDDNISNEIIQDKHIHNIKPNIETNNHNSSENDCNVSKYDDINDSINIYNPQKELTERLNDNQDDTHCKKNDTTWKSDDINSFINNNSIEHLENFNKHSFPDLYNKNDKIDLNNKNLKNLPLYEIYNKMSNNQIKNLANDFNNFDNSFYKNNEYTNYSNLEKINEC